MDLPQHGARKNQEPEFLPWIIEPELKIVADFLQQNYLETALYANSISAWLSLISFPQTFFLQAYFVSPVVDMEHLILNMLAWAQVSEAQLAQAGEIVTDFGQTLSFKYLEFARAHKNFSWNTPIQILYGANDTMTSLTEIESFAANHKAKLTIMPKGEHWFHTPEQLTFLTNWLNAHA